MSNSESPIEITVNTRRFLMDGHNGVLQLRLRNRSNEESFIARISVSGLLLPEPFSRSFEMPPGGDSDAPTQLAMHADKAAGQTTAGDALFNVNLIVTTPGGERHRFSGQFVLTVLAHAESMGDITVNVSELVHQKDKGGMGSVNEFDLRNLVNLPEYRTVNDFLQEKRTPRFEEIRLVYDGKIVVDPPPPVIVDRPNIEKLSQCSLIHTGNPQRTLVLTDDAIVLGKNRQDTDIVTWVMPRTPDNDHSTRHISRQHCRLRLHNDGVWVEHLSGQNPTRINGNVVKERAMLSPGGSVCLGLSTVMTLTVTPLPFAHIDRAIVDFVEQGDDASAKERWELTRRMGIGGFLIQRQDALAERECYLWLLSVAALPDLKQPTSHSSSGLCLLSLPHLAVTPAAGQDAIPLTGMEVTRASAAYITYSDSMTAAGVTRIVEPFKQQALETGEPASR